MRLLIEIRYENIDANISCLSYPYFHTPQNQVTTYPSRSPDFRSSSISTFSAGNIPMDMHANGITLLNSLFTVTGSFRTHTGFPLNFSRKLEHLFNYR